MKAIQVREFANPEAIVLNDFEDPPFPKAGEVVIRLHAAGVNPADFYVVNGLFQLPPSLPFTPGFEAAGQVTAIGPNVTDLTVGSRVLVTLPYLRDGTATFGAMAEQLTVPASNAVVIPDDMSYSVAAAVPVMFGTAYIALQHRARLQAGDVLLVTGATGATGSAAVQIGKRLGATVIATASGAAKLELAASLGADYVIDYRTEHVADRLREISNGRGVDVAFETVGGDLFEATVSSMAKEGRLLPIGMASGIIPQLSMIRVLAGNFAIVGTDFAHYTLNHLDLVRTALQDIMCWYSPDERMFQFDLEELPLTEAAAAIAKVQKGAGTKVVLTM